jgi:hypothetical protein
MGCPLLSAWTECLDCWVLGLLSAWTAECLDCWLLGLLSAWTTECLDYWVLGLLRACQLCIQCILCILAYCAYCILCHSIAYCATAMLNAYCAYGAYLHTKYCAIALHIVRAWLCILNRVHTVHGTHFNTVHTVPLYCTMCILDKY